MRTTMGGWMKFQVLLLVLAPAGLQLWTVELALEQNMWCFQWNRETVCQSRRRGSSGEMKTSLIVGSLRRAFWLGGFLMFTDWLKICSGLHAAAFWRASTIKHSSIGCSAPRGGRLSSSQLYLSYSQRICRLSEVTKIHVEIWGWKDRERITI